MSTSKITHLGIDKFIDRLLHAFRDTHTRFMLAERGAIQASPTLPIMVGAGISSSAQIPLNNELLRTCHSFLLPEQDQKYENTFLYREVYENIKKTLSSETPESYIKFKLRNLLTNAGIPRENENVFPNISNFLLVHLVRHKFFGPVISFNVDPLLSTAAKMTHRPNLPIEFIVNISQFSDMVGNYDLKTDLDSVIFQPHGTIEEPFSLRFLEHELLDQEKAIQQAILNSLKSRTSLACVGLNLQTEMTLKFVKEWKQSHSYDTLNFYVGLYDRKTPDDIQNELEKLADDNFKVYVANDIDSDSFFASLAIETVKATAKDRGKSICRFHVPPVTKFHIRNIMYKTLNDMKPTSEGRGNSKVYMPRMEEQAILEIAMLCLVSRGPFSMVDAFSIPLTDGESYVSRSRSAKKALTSLLQSNVLTFCSCKDDSDKGDSKLSYSEKPNFSGIDDILRIRLIRSKELSTIDSFTEKICAILGINVSEKERGRLRLLFQELELNRESPYSLNRADITSVCFSKESCILPTHEELNRRMDILKNNFKVNVEKDFPIKCCIITETGEHLFKKGELKKIGKVENAHKSNIESSVRDWILPIYKHKKSSDSPQLQIIVSKDRGDWFIDEERKAREKIISKLLKYMGDAPCIKIHKIPWDEHHDHMWFYSLKSKHVADFQGIYFPRSIDTQSYFGIHVASEEDVIKLQDVFDSKLRINVK